MAHTSQADMAPRVVAKGYGSLAETIIRTAKENNLYTDQAEVVIIECEINQFEEV